MVKAGVECACFREGADDAVVAFCVPPPFLPVACVSGRLFAGIFGLRLDAACHV
jgi:hypothetical protein